MSYYDKVKSPHRAMVVELRIVVVKARRWMNGEKVVLERIVEGAGNTARLRYQLISR